MIDDIQLRRGLANLLIEDGVALSQLGRVIPGGFLGPVFRALSVERFEQAASVLRRYPDPELADAADTEDLPAGAEQAAEAAGVAAALGDLPAAAEAIARTVRLIDALADLPVGLVEPDLLEALMAQVRSGLDRLRQAREQTYNASRNMNFSTKSMGRDDDDVEVPVYEVWYGTNRKPVITDGKLEGFSVEFGDGVTLGKCAVSIPATHRFGETKPSWWRRLTAGDRALSLEDVSQMQAAPFWASLGDVLRENGAAAGDAIIFLHGYNVSFEDAAINAAQMGADLNVPGGAMAFFSWPSRGNFGGYVADEVSIEASEVSITEFLEAFVINAGARRVHLVAHSMGNRGLLRAVNRIAATVSGRANKPFGQIVLAAPDVDWRTFEMLHHAYAAVSDRTTLYVSGKDLAVRSSRGVHDADRVGFTPPIVILPNIDTVSVTKVDLSMIGHGYFSGCRPVLQDIHQVLVNAIAPNRRGGVVLRTTAAGPYWELAA